MQLQHLLTRLISAVGLMSPFGMVLGALFVPIFVAVAADKVGVGVVATFMLLSVLIFLATIGIGLRFGTWRALFLSLVPGSWAALMLAVSVVARTGLGEGFELAVLFFAIASLIWLAGIAVGVQMRKVVFRRSQLFQ